MKNFKLRAEEIIHLIPAMGSCFATDKITVDGLKVGYMYREKPDNLNESGWFFQSGTEDQEYIDNADNITLYNVNTIANYDKTVIPYLNLPYGKELERISGTDEFVII